MATRSHHDKLLDIANLNLKEAQQILQLEQATFDLQLQESQQKTIAHVEIKSDPRRTREEARLAMQHQSQRYKRDTADFIARMQRNQQRIRQARKVVSLAQEQLVRIQEAAGDALSVAEAVAQSLDPAQTFEELVQEDLQKPQPIPPYAAAAVAGGLMSDHLVAVMQGAKYVRTSDAKINGDDSRATVPNHLLHATKV